MTQSLYANKSVRMKSYYYLIVAFSLLIGCMTDSGLDRGHFVSDTSEPVKFDIDYVSELIIISAEVNGVSGKFLFDNGFSLSAVSPDFGKRANIQFGGGASVRDANSNSASVPEATVDTVSIAGLAFVNTGFYQMDTKKFFPCDTIDGVIGASIINKANWRIDFENMEMQISAAPFPEEGSKLGFTVSRNNSSFVKVSVKGITVKCKIDLGSTDVLNFDWRHVGDAFIGLPCVKGIGIMSLSAHGLGNVDTTYATAEEQLVSHSGTELTRPGTVLLEKDLKYEGYIGLSYFKGYDVIINSTDKQYILKGNEEPEDMAIDSSYGVGIYLVEDTWKIIHLNANDPLLSDIELMTEIRMIDSLPMSNFASICDYRQYVKDKLETKQSMTVSLVGRTDELKLLYRAREAGVVPAYQK